MWFNEVLQWGAIGGIGFLLLGLYRALVVQSSQVEGDTLEALNGPPMGKPLPAFLASRLPQSEDGTVVVAVVENCPGCKQLLATLGKRHRGGARESRIAVVSLNPSDPFKDALAEITDTVVAVTGHEWADLNIQATPLWFRVDRNHRVKEKGTTNAPEEILEPVGDR